MCCRCQCRCQFENDNDSQNQFRCQNCCRRWRCGWVWNGRCWKCCCGPICDNDC